MRKVESSGGKVIDEPELIKDTMVQLLQTQMDINIIS